MTRPRPLAEEPIIKESTNNIPTFSTGNTTKLTKSHQHINPISFDSGQEGPHLLISAGVHGDEYEPILAVQALREAVSEEAILSKGKLTLVSVVNRSAYIRGERTGADGKDLARTCPGKKDGSITEQTASEISELIRSADYFLDMHTGGNLFEIFPMVGYMLSADPDLLDQQRAMAQAFNLPLIWGTSPDLDGRTLSVARDAGIPAIYTEYGGGGDCKEHIIQSLKAGCINLMKHLGMSPGSIPEQTDTKYIVEDYSAGSGHLQVMHPSPLAGIFTACFELGKIVHKGQKIGTVQDPLSNEKSAIHASNGGLLFLLRSFGLVDKDEATAGILPISQPGKITIS